MLSSRTLDFWLLALCSCILTVLCHSAASVLSVPATTTSAITHSSTGSNSAGGMNVTFSNFITMPSARPKLEEEDEQA